MSRSLRTIFTHFSLTGLTSVFAALYLAILPWQARYILVRGELHEEYWEFGTFALYATDIVLLILCVSGVVAMQEQRLRGQKSVVYACIAFALFAAFSIDASGDQGSSFLQWFSLICRGLVPAVILSQVAIREQWIVYGAIIGGSIQSMLAALQYYTQQVVAFPFSGMADHVPEVFGAAVIQVGDDRVLRAYGALPHPNILGGYLVVTLACALGAWTTYRLQRYQRGIVLCAIVIISAGIWFSLSRQAWVALACVLVLWTVTSIIRSRLTILSILLVASCVVFPLAALSVTQPSIVATRFFVASGLEEHSLRERQHVIEDSRVFIRDHAFFGIGIGQTTYQLFMNDVERQREDAVVRYQPIHLLPILMWQEAGLYSLTIWIGLVLSVYVWALQHRRILSPFVLALTALVCVGLFDHYLWTLPFGVTVLWSVLALAMPKK